MRNFVLAAALGAAGFAIAGCDSSGTAEAGNNVSVMATGTADDTAPDGSAGVQASGNINVNLPERVDVEGVTVGPDGVTVTTGDTNASVKTGRDPSVSVTTNRQ